MEFKIKESELSQRQSKHIWTLFLRENFNDIEFLKKFYNLQEIERFYQLEGEKIFKFAIMSAKSSHMKYLMQNCERKFILNCITERNLEILCTVAKICVEEKWNESDFKLLKTKIELIFGFGEDAINFYLNNEIPEQLL